MPPIKFWLNRTYGLGGDVIWRISKWPPWWRFWIVERNHFSNSESLCHCDASHQLLAQSNLCLRRDVVWRISRWLHGGGHLGYQNGTTLSILNLYVAPMPPIKFWLNPTYGLGGDVVWSISRWPLWRPSWILEQKDFSNSESLQSLPSSFISIWLILWD